MNTAALSPTQAKPTIEGNELIEYGFIHVTGLQFTSKCPGRQRGVVTPTVTQLGTYAHNNGFTIIVTEHGKVWIGTGELPREVLCRACPNAHLGDTGMTTASVVFVDCTEQFAIWDLLHRSADPEWNPKDSD